jgi:YggT family protein
LLIRIIELLLIMLSLAILVRVILSWIIPLTGGRPHPMLVSVISVVNQVTEPILAPLRRVIPSIGSLDLSPMAALIIISIIISVVLPRLSAALGQG